MQLDGEWYVCDDQVVRPVVRGEVLTADQSWVHVEFLLDTGADRTVFDADTLLALGMGASPAGGRLVGLGGIRDITPVQTAIRFRRENGSPILLRGEYAALADPEALDMSVLGRDITELFAVIVDRPGRTVCMLGQRHRYRIEQS
jgi:hypothetical protein